jgi:hypothetical protein
MEKQLPQKHYWAQATVNFFLIKKKLHIIFWFSKYFSLNGKQIASKTLLGTSHIDRLEIQKYYKFMMCFYLFF